MEEINIYSSLYGIFKAANNLPGIPEMASLVSTEFQSDKPDILLCYEVIDCHINRKKKHYMLIWISFI